MKRPIREVMRDFIPPVAVPPLLRLFGKVRFQGNYATWEDAQRASTGYGGDLILDKVKTALLKVKQGEAAYERDGVLFDKIEYSWPLLAGLLWIASRNGNRLNLVDFGGSLGSSYFQNRKFLMQLDECRWSIVEQEKLVACGRQYFEDEHLRFFTTLDDCMSVQHPDTLLMSSVLPYLEKPYEFLADVVRRNFHYLLVDRTPFLASGDDRLTVQTVSPEIYQASYPAWFFNRKKFLDFLAGYYDLIEEFDSFESFAVGGTASRSKGFIFMKRDAAP